MRSQKQESGMECTPAALDTVSGSANDGFICRPASPPPPAGRTNMPASMDRGPGHQASTQSFVMEAT